jgi:hypothetical protein
MPRFVMSLCVCLLVALPAVSDAPASPTPPDGGSWTFAVSGDSRNCGDFVMPAIAARVKAEGDAFYWHLGDLRAIYKQDEDFVSMETANVAPLSLAEYSEVAWDDFLVHQMAPFGDVPVFLGRGNHETIAPMTRDRFDAKFSAFLNRPEIQLQNRADGASSFGGQAPPSSPWYHFVRNGVDFITLDNASNDEFSDAQLTWLRAVLRRDQDPKSGVTTIVAGMHEALPHSTSSGHSMDDWYRGTETGEVVYHWFAAAEKAGKHVYLLASHSHFYSPAIYDTSFWKKEGIVLPGIIIGSAGAQRYVIPPTASPESKTDIYAYLKATVHSDGTVRFELEQISKDEMIAVKWPSAPMSQIDFCYEKNTQTPAKPN